MFYDFPYELLKLTIFVIFIMVRDWFIIFIRLLYLVHSTQSFRGKRNKYLSSMKHAKSRTDPQTEKDSMSNGDFILSSIESAQSVRISKKANPKPYLNIDMTQLHTKNRFQEAYTSNLHDQNKVTIPQESGDLYGLSTPLQYEEDVKKTPNLDAKEVEEPGFKDYYDKIINYNDTGGELEEIALLPIKDQNIKKVVSDLILHEDPESIHTDEKEESPILLNPALYNILSTTQVPLHTYDWNMFCKFQPNGYNCDGSGRFIHGFYFDLKLEDCRDFDFGSCTDNYNKFHNRRECKITCEAAGLHELQPSNIPGNAACRMQADFGQCHEYYPMFYYDLTAQLCKGFAYSGCGGNANRFSTAKDCASHCGQILTNAP